MISASLRIQTALIAGATIASGASVALSQMTTRVCVQSDSVRPAISADGRLVAFQTSASGTPSNVLVYDRFTGLIEPVSVSSSGQPANDSSESPAISADGRVVAFSSRATNLVYGDHNGFADVFVHDRLTGATTRESPSVVSGDADAASDSPSLSGDGRYVAFASDADNLVAGDTNRVEDVFVRDRETGGIVRASVDSAGGQANGRSRLPSISADGRFVAFSSNARNLVPGGTSPVDHVYVRDLQSGLTSIVSVSSGSVPGNSSSFTPSISADGRVIAFFSLASNLVANDAGPYADVFVRDLATGVTSRVSVASDNREANGRSYDPSVSGDGRFVAFTSEASNLVSGDTNGTHDIFVHDRATRVTTRVSLSTEGAEGDRASESPAVSAAARFVAFASLAGTLVPGDTGGAWNVYLYDQLACAAGRVNDGFSAVAGVLTVNGSADFASIAVGAPVTFALDAAPRGPAPARYVVWVWAGAPSLAENFESGAAALGCTVNPTPLAAGRAPQPMRCLRTASLPAQLCAGVRELSGPARAPWTLIRAPGLPLSATLTLQGLLEDAGAANPARFSATNCVVLRVQ